MQGNSPEEIFGNFREHLNDLLHHTVTQAPLVQIVSGGRLFLDFHRDGDSTAVAVGRGYHLFLTQTLQAKKIKAKDYRLRTLAYAYRIGLGPARTDDWLVRWEYNSRELQPDALHPRHHCHLSTEVKCGAKTLNLDRLHIATGWVTIEEVIRFIIHELDIKPLRPDWDARLRKSEEKFLEWTGRSV